MFQTKKFGGIDKKSILQLILIMLLLQGCIETSVPPRRAAVRAVQPVSCPGLYEIKPALLVAVLVDRSGSVQDTNSGRPIQARTEEGLSLSRIKADIASLVGQLGPATLIVVRFISEQSYRDEELVLADALPDMPKAVNCSIQNPFDPLQGLRCKRAEDTYHNQLDCINKARKRIREVLTQMHPDRASRSDIWGAIAAVAEFFSSHPPSVRKVLYLYTDAIDNVGTALGEQPTGLERVQVVVRTARGGNPKELQKHLNLFRNRLMRLRAHHVQQSPLEVPIHVGEAWNYRLSKQ